MIRKIYLCYLKKRRPVKYAEVIGVNIQPDLRLMSGIDFGSEPYLITIGAHVTISNSVQFITHDGGTWTFRNEELYKDVVKYGKISIGDNCFIGAQSIILPGVKIENNCVIAAGSVVTKSVPEGVVVAGNPARILCTTKDYAKKSLDSCPKYNINNYKNNKIEEVKEICEKYSYKSYLKNK